MKKNNTQEFTSSEIDSLSIENNTDVVEEIFMGHRVCDKCGHDKDVSGGKACSKGHFICHSCAKYHVHCPLCGHTLR